MMDTIYSDVASQILLAHSSRPESRLLVAIAGPPGSGKTTVATGVVELLNRRLEEKPLLNGASSQIAQANCDAVLVPMDGFHFSREYLDTLPNRTEASLRRGAPWTFDVKGIMALVQSLKDSANLPLLERPIIAAPSFDHNLKDPVHNDVQIPPEAKIVILEGNYLLLNIENWQHIGEQMDLRIFVDVDPKLARARVAKRHVKAGIESTLEQGFKRFDLNDGINGDMIRNNLTQYDIRVESIDTA